MIAPTTLAQASGFAVALLITAIDFGSDRDL